MIIPQNISFVMFLILVFSVFGANYIIISIVGGFQKYLNFSSLNSQQNHINHTINYCLKNKDFLFKTTETAFSFAVVELIVLVFISLLSTY